VPSRGHFLKEAAAAVASKRFYLVFQLAVYKRLELAWYYDLAERAAVHSKSTSQRPPPKQPRMNRRNLTVRSLSNIYQPYFLIHF